MSYSDYKNARDAAWEFLIQSRIKKLPVDMGKICAAHGFELYSYTTGIGVIKALGYESQCGKSDGFSVLKNGTYYIFYSEKCVPGRQRFSIAHEIGHIVLGHLRDGRCTILNREPSPPDNPVETQANQFAARLLAPACVLNALNATAPEEISVLCGISKQAAQFRAARMHTLQKRQKFLSHPLERQVMKQFRCWVFWKRLI